MMYLVSRLQSSVEVQFGVLSGSVKVSNGVDGVVGFLPVFDDLQKAEEYAEGAAVLELVEVEK